MAYLARWRLNLGAEMLQSAADSVAEVAAVDGSEAAFNRAFQAGIWLSAGTIPPQS